MKTSELLQTTECTGRAMVRLENSSFGSRTVMPFLWVELVAENESFAVEVYGSDRIKE